MDFDELLENVYNNALNASDKYIKIGPSVKADVETIVAKAENNRGIVAVLTTLLVYKIACPTQDIRYHQSQLEGGFSGRTIDEKHITPFLKKVEFPSMAESGWLTRSLEQAHPYTLDYPGKITPINVKNAFLRILNDIQVNDVSPELTLIYFFHCLIKEREKLKVDLAKPHSLSIANIIKVLEKHFSAYYKGSGASRLPTLAIYAAYQCMKGQVARYDDKVLCPLESHTSADSQSGRIGDIDIVNSDGTAYEGVEIKHGIQITEQLVKDAYEKFKIYKTDRYYLLTTANMDSADWDSIDNEIEKISKIHGCQVIVNGVYSTLKYYLRLIKDPSEFIDNYVELLKVDKNIKYQHKIKWNEIISDL